MWFCAVQSLHQSLQLLLDVEFLVVNEPQSQCCLNHRIMLLSENTAYLEASTNGGELGLLQDLFRQRMVEISNKRAPRSIQQCLMFCHNIVFIFIKKLISLVSNLLSRCVNDKKPCQILIYLKIFAYISCIMIDCEGCLASFGLLKRPCPF